MRRRGRGASGWVRHRATGGQEDHASYFMNLVAEPMEPIRAELLRMATELEAVKGQAGRHLPQQFGASRLDYGDFAFRMEGCAAVLSRDGQGGALLREVAMLG